jgi:hypothetical protein
MRSAFLALLAFGTLAAGCNPFAPDDRDYLIKVDSVTGPSVVSGGAPFTVRVYGFVGGNGCHHFQEFRVSRAAGTAHITVMGRREGDTRSLCTANIVMLEGEALTIEPPITDPFVLRFYQPDRTILAKTIRAE